MKFLNIRDNIKFALILVWLVFTVVFALWWFKFSIDNIGLLARLEPGRMEHWDRQRTMIFWEGSSWIVLLLLGGLALIALMLRERARARQVREFFASFSHEIKTSLASLRVQAEALKDDLGSQSSPILDRLIGDTVRLHLQLENSLFYASPDTLNLFAKPLDLSLVVERLREQWPGLVIKLHGRCKLNVDDRALRTILSNLVQNAIVHGDSTSVNIQVVEVDASMLMLTLHDNGKGFSGDVTRLGTEFNRPKSNSGSGLGLYICRMLAKRMGGRIDYQSSPEGFTAALQLPGRLQ